MSNIKFVSHEAFPEDQYTKELVYLCLDDRYRVAYVRKQAKTGGMFWSVPSVSVTKNAAKGYHPTFMVDSSFLDADIRTFLEKRPWEAGKAASLNDSEVPF